MDLTLIDLDAPTETRSFEKGRFDVYRVGPTTLGRATYEPYVSLHVMGSEDYAT
jgi:hypothetical protein